MNELVSTEWLHKNLNKEGLVILDASLPSTAQGKEFKYIHTTIPSARYFDLKNHFSDTKSNLPNTFPNEEQFELESKKLGINKDSKIIVFDNLGIYSSPRVWWLFKVMGHDNIAILNGGLPEWIQKGFQTKERTKEPYKFGNFKAKLDNNFVIKYHEIKENITNRTFTIIDARSEGRFSGTEKEPRKQLKSGNIKGSINIPYKEVLNNGKYKSKTELQKLFEEKGNLKDKLVFSCGSGLTACIVLVASHIAFKQSPYLYDGSWTEWAENNHLKYFE